MDHWVSISHCIHNKILSQCAPCAHKSHITFKPNCPLCQSSSQLETTTSLFKQKTSRSVSAAEKGNIAGRQSWLCNICDKPFKAWSDITVDHTHELHDHGQDVVENLQVLCYSCHNQKNNKEWRKDHPNVFDPCLAQQKIKTKELYNDVIRDLFQFFSKVPEGMHGTFKDEILQSAQNISNQLITNKKRNRPSTPPPPLEKPDGSPFTECMFTKSYTSSSSCSSKEVEIIGYKKNNKKLKKEKKVTFSSTQEIVEYKTIPSSWRETVCGKEIKRLEIIYGRKDKLVLSQLFHEIIDSFKTEDRMKLMIPYKKWYILIHFEKETTDFIFNFKDEKNVDIMKQSEKNKFDINFKIKSSTHLKTVFHIYNLLLKDAFNNNHGMVRMVVKYECEEEYFQWIEKKKEFTVCNEREFLKLSLK